MGLNSVVSHLQRRAVRAGLVLALLVALVCAYSLTTSASSTRLPLSLQGFSLDRVSKSSSAGGMGRTPAAWWDLRAIAAQTRPTSQTIVPVQLRHFNNGSAPAPFIELYAVSAWLDTRPVVVGMPPQVAILATMPGAGYMSYPSGQFPSNPVQCFVVVRERGTWGRRGKTTHFVGQTTLNALPDPHEYERDFVTVLFNCALSSAEGETIAGWETAEIYATLSLPSLPPAPSTFLPVSILPRLDTAKHITGAGPTAMCMPPLTGDIYAPYLRDFVAHYRALGFTRFWTYLLDPGPKTLEVMRELALDEEITPVRWALPKGWLYSAQVEDYRPQRGFAVHPSRWNVPGIEPLPKEVEDTLGVSQNGEFDVRVW